MTMRPSSSQRSIKARTKGVVEEDYKDLLNFEKSTRYDDRQKAALAYAEAITWDLDTDDAFWAREFFRIEKKVCSEEESEVHNP
jgi:alkylhydroperoxidase family enzyme